MNTVTKTIAQKAALLFQERHGMVQVYNEEFISVLMEIIVQECVTIIDHNGNYLVDDVATKKIKEHFGVK